MRNLLGFFKSFFPKRRQQDIVKKGNGNRALVLEPGDSCLILKENGKSIIVDSGSEKLNRGDEIICMVWCYLANPDFVRILDQMFSDIVDEVNADKLRDNATVGRSGAYYSEQKGDGEKNES